MTPTPESAPQTSIRPIQRRLLVPLTAVLLLLIGGFTALSLGIHGKKMNQTSELLLRSASDELDESVAEQSLNLETLIRVILDNESVIAAMVAHDRDTLLRKCEPLFAQIRDTYAITHFYFHGPDRVNLLRVHNSERSGDLIERFTLREAERTLKPASGLELGPMGTFTLRVVAPVFEGDALIGYVELGKEIEDVLNHTQTKHGIELVATINKTMLQRESWEAGMKMLGREGDWNRFPDQAIIYSTMGHCPEEAAHLIGRRHAQMNTMVEVEIDDKPWRAMISPLTDATGSRVGELFAFQDLSLETAQFNRMIAISSAAAISLASVLIAFLYLMLRRVDRGIETARKSLLVAKAAADTASQAKSAFLANMSHEIRTPMTAILGFAENLLNSDQSESEKLSCVQTIRRNGESLLGIINDVLDLSKIEAGKMDTTRAACNPCEVIADVLSLVRVQADAKGLPIHVEYASALPKTIRTDPTRLRQILINLVANAIKFTETGSIRILTRLVNDNDEPRLQIDISDTGRGIPDNEKERLFQPFVQMDDSATRRSGGTGLGLTISKRFAGLLGGDVTVVETRLGVGSTFRVTVATGPLGDGKMIEHPLSATVVVEDANTIDEVPRTELHGLRILLAEDGPDNQRLISFVLKKAGADVVVEENGKLASDSALAAADGGKPFDVVLMDMQMPVMDGYEATGELRKKGYTGPVIALTAHAMASDRDKCINAGCDDYATKPIDRRKLIEMIQRHRAPTDSATAKVAGR